MYKIKLMTIAKNKGEKVKVLPKFPSHMWFAFLKMLPWHYCSFNMQQGDFNESNDI